MNLRYRLLAVCTVFAIGALTACGGGSSGGGMNPPPPPPPPSPTNPPNPADCPISGSSPSSVAQAGGTLSIGRRAPVARGSGEVPGLLVVRYSPNASSQTIAEAATRAHATELSDLDLSAIRMRVKTISVDPAQADAIVTQLKATPGVLSVTRAQYRHALAGSPNDPVYRGNNIPPYFQSANARGQWDMHAMNFDGAWALFAGTTVVGAPIAIVDTGVDVTQTELTGGKIVRTRCFVTYPVTAPQSTGTFVTDTDGHGTNVAGIADADTNNSFEFAGGGWSAPLLAYRIFPAEPSPPCDDPSQSNNPQCSTTDVDEASAINDAVANGAKVINLSLGATPPCTDPVEQTAVENAIAAGVVVVAAAGNESAADLDCPAGYAGVIAVGATSLNDSVTPIKEYVASYSNFLNTNGGGLFMVAPGGDPCSGSTSSACSDPDFLHWIVNLYSSTGAPIGGMAVTCGSDCSVRIAGTSQATPHVVGVVSLMRAVKPSLTPAQIAQDLCATADNIGDAKQGCGRVNAAAAVTRAMGP